MGKDEGLSSRGPLCSPWDPIFITLLTTIPLLCLEYHLSPEPLEPVSHFA